MPDAPSRGEQFLLAALACVAVAAFGASYDQMLAWALWAPCLASAFWRIPSAPAGLRKTVQAITWGLIAVSTALGLVLMAFPIAIEPATAVRATLLLGYSLAVLCALFALGTPVWTPGAALIPCAVALLAVGLFNPIAAIRGLISTSGAILFAYLGLHVLDNQWRRLLRWRAWARFGVPAACAAGVAAAIMLLLPLAQSGVEMLTFQWFLRGSSGYAGFSTSSQLGDIERLKLSTAVVMRVWTDRPQHLRARVFTRFDGRTWQVRPSPATPLLAAPPQTMAESAFADWLERIPGATYLVPGEESSQADERNTVRTRIVQSAYNNVMVAPGLKLLVQAPLDRLQVDEWETLVTPVTTSVDVYGILHRRTGELVQAGPATEESLAEALALPEDTDRRLRALAAQLSEGAASADERVRRTVNYVENECRYSLDVGKFHSAQPVAEFLFEKKKGYCQYFASAAAVLLRLQNVPTRYVQGFHVGEGNRLGGHYVVRELDAHAWIEAYIPGRGWIEVDPTPAAEYEALHAGLRGGALDAAWEWLRATFAEVAAMVSRADWRALWQWTWANLKALVRLVFTTGLGAVLLLAAAAWLALRWRRRVKKVGRAKPKGKRKAVAIAEPSPELATLLAQVDHALSDCGCRRPAACAPLEHLNSITSARVGKALRTAARDAVECYYRASFGGADISPDTLAHLRDALDAALPASN